MCTGAADAGPSLSALTAISAVVSSDEGLHEGHQAFEDYHRSFSILEKAAETMLKDIKSFTDSVSKLFNSGAEFAQHFAVIFSPISSEFDLNSKHPEAAHTLNNIHNYETAMTELQSTVAPELELIESRIVGPMKELQAVMKMIRKTIVKREHKLMDYDRHNNSLMKLRDKKEKSLSDEKNLFKLEQEFEVATNEYDYINTALKNDLPRFMTLSTQFIDPLWHSFFYMQLQIYYLVLEKVTSFAEESKYDISNVPGQQIQSDYEEKRTNAWETIEELGIIKRIVSVSRLVQQSRGEGGVSRTVSASSGGSSFSKGPPSGRSVSAGAAFKKAPPPPPGTKPGAPAPPPPYSPSPAAASSSSVASAKKAPPPPPPLKPKPKPAAPAVQYVTALYDFDAQAEGDLSFRAGDRIEVVERTENAEDWWTGRLNGQQGVFPGNYVQTS
ncbi:hypothetical protein HDZ31DRAFT_80540 [Schizophyllum fasciatum]